MKKTLLSMALAASGLLLAPSAFAVVTVTGTISNVHYQLFDLDLSDGITPAVTFASTSAQVYTSASSTNNITSDPHSASGALGSVLSTSSVMGANTAAASTSAGGLFGAGIGPGGTVSASAIGANGVAYAQSYVVEGAFTLTPHTLLVFTANTSGLGILSTQTGETGDVGASVYLQSATNGAQYSQGYSSVNLQADGTQNNYLSPSLTASFSNLSGAALTGYAYAYVYAQVRGVGVVPEPETYALFLAGLACVGFVVKRRQPN